MSNQSDVKAFEEHWKDAKYHLCSMIMNPVMTMDQSTEFISRIRRIEELVIEVSDIARSDKD